MDKEQKVFLFAAMFMAVIMLLWALVGPSIGLCEEEEIQPVKMRVMVKLLNGRAEPSKKSMVEARFDQYDILECWRWSEKHNWIEVTGGESGTVWVCWKYLTERWDESTWWNCSGQKVKIRKTPFGTVIGYLKPDGEIVVDQIVLGWGHCSRGWVDLSYLDEEL